LWISEAEVVSMMDLGEAIEALENGLLTEAQGDAANMTKTHVAWGNGSTLHAIGAAYPKDGFAGTKTWSHTGGGATPLLILFDSENGSLKAIIEAFALGQMRTASASGVATKWLATPETDDFAIIGTGKQAITQVASVLAVRRIKRVRVFGRNKERLEQFADCVRKEFELEVTPARSIAEAVEGAGVITVVTRATEPVLSAEMIGVGAHVNAIGAIVPSRAEIAANVLPRCSRIVVDSVAQAQKLSKELIEFIGPPDHVGWKQVISLSELVAARESREVGDDITLFKSLGMGISDLALGMRLYQKACEVGIGRELSHPQRVTPRLRAGRINK
jgi:ornithine cyclodeaminase